MALIQKLKQTTVGLISLSCISCVTMGNTYSDEDFSKLKQGMIEEEVISILKSKPNARTENSDGTYLLQWMYSYGTPVGGSGRHIALLFGADRRLIKVKHQFQMGPEPLIK